MATINDDRRVANRFKVARTTADLPEGDVNGAWQVPGIEFALRPDVQNDGSPPSFNLAREDVGRDGCGHRLPFPVRLPHLPYDEAPRFHLEARQCIRLDNTQRHRQPQGLA